VCRGALFGHKEGPGERAPRITERANVGPEERTPSPRQGHLQQTPVVRVLRTHALLKEANHAAG